MKTIGRDKIRKKPLDHDCYYLEQDIENLKRIEQGIQPYSKWWRWGFLSSVRRAIRIMEILKQDGMIVVHEIRRR